MADLLTPLAPKSIDLILANPPYVSTIEMHQLPPEYRYEPYGALQADEEGVALAVDLLLDATRVLSDSGLLILEVGESGLGKPGKPYIVKVNLLGYFAPKEEG